jgi:hypothetical protein
VKRPAILHRALKAGVRAFNGNPWTSNRLELVPRDANSYYKEDGLWTNRSHAFVDDDRFREAYERAVRAAGWDYRIRWRAHTILWAAATAASVDGAFVECGTGRGFMSSAICEYLAWSDRAFYLYDTFEPTLLNQIGARTGETSDYYATSADAVRENFAEWPGVRLVVGQLPGTLDRTPDRVAFLHVDLNHAPPEQAVVRHFWPRMTTGGVLVYDDYGFVEYEASRRAADELSRELGFAIFASPTGQGIVVKTASS